MIPILFFTVLLACFLGIPNGISTDLDSCIKREVIAKCGENPDPLTWNVLACPEKDEPSTEYLIYGQYRDTEEYLAKFLNCRTCYPNGQLRCRSCPKAKYGTFCERDCKCQNGGVCNRKGKCSCPEEFEGIWCENKKICDCENGGICSSEGICLCPKGFQGSMCEQRKECGCINKGNCTLEGKCLCTYEFEGPKCLFRSECNCRNRGYCRRNGKCLCLREFEGAKCQISRRCGKPFPGRTPLITYGNVTKIGQWPWQAALFRCSTSSGDCYFKCGGSLLNDLWVITAAHCVPSVTFDPPEENYRIFLGLYHRNFLEPDEYFQEPENDGFFIHPNYNSKTLNADIALIKLKKPVQFNTRVQPVCLPTLQTSANNIVAGKNGVVTGWGRTEDDRSSEILKEAVLRVISEQDCRGRIRYVFENKFCTGHPEPFAPGPYYGDSGGPMVFRDPFSKTPRWVLEGISSSVGTTVMEDERVFKIGVFTKVSKFLDWIQYYLARH